MLAADKEKDCGSCEALLVAIDASVDELELGPGKETGADTGAVTSTIDSEAPEAMDADELVEKETRERYLNHTRDMLRWLHLCSIVVLFLLIALQSLDLALSYSSTTLASHESIILIIIHLAQI